MIRLDRGKGVGAPHREHSPEVESPHVPIRFRVVSHRAQLAAFLLLITCTSTQLLLYSPGQLPNPTESGARRNNVADTPAHPSLNNDVHQFIEKFRCGCVCKFSQNFQTQICHSGAERRTYRVARRLCAERRNHNRTYPVTESGSWWYASPARKGSTFYCFLDPVGVPPATPSCGRSNMATVAPPAAIAYTNLATASTRREGTS
jgi:hypothetical protein